MRNGRNHERVQFPLRKVQMDGTTLFTSVRYSSILFFSSSSSSYKSCTWSQNIKTSWLTTWEKKNQTLPRQHWEPQTNKTIRATGFAHTLCLEMGLIDHFSPNVASQNHRRVDFTFWTRARPQFECTQAFSWLLTDVDPIGSYWLHWLGKIYSIGQTTWVLTQAQRNK